MLPIPVALRLPIKRTVLAVLVVFTLLVILWVLVLAI
jgi:type II secretory pathway component PulM